MTKFQTSYRRCGYPDIYKIHQKHLSAIIAVLKEHGITATEVIGRPGYIFHVYFWGHYTRVDAEHFDIAAPKRIIEKYIAVN